MILQNINNNERRKYEFRHSRLRYYNNYEQYLKTLDITKDTVEWRLKHIRGFLNFLEINKISISKIKTEYVYEYLSSLEKLSARTKEHRAICIRLFLNWLFNNNITNMNGLLILPTIKCNKDEVSLSYYTDEEVTKIINAVDIHNPNGKRDLAILLLFVYLGVRSNDVSNLKLDNIKWNENKIIIVHSKNNIINSFIMPQELRYALLDYLKNERKNTDAEYVFVNNDNTMFTNQKIHHIITKYFILANINIDDKKHGPHSLRHSLATSIINKNHSIYEVSSILGHTNISQATVYAKIDFNTLKKLSLEVPKWKN